MFALLPEGEPVVDDKVVKELQDGDSGHAHAEAKNSADAGKEVLEGN